MAKLLTVILGVILVLLGFLGFTSNALIGADAIFAADAALNIIHLILGGALLVVAFWFCARAELWLKIVGSVTFLIGLIGLLTVPSAGGTLLGIAYANGASDWFHLIAGVVIFTTGFYVRSDENRPASPPTVAF